MKSAYELAMERLQKSAPLQPLTEEQKNKISEIDSIYRSRIAEREVFLTSQISQARLSGHTDVAETLQQELARDIRALNSECEDKKEKVRRG